MLRSWHSWGQASPLWVPGLILIAVGVALVWAARQSVKRGARWN